MNSRFLIFLFVLAMRCHADPLQVLLIRHGEKPEGKRDPHLTTAGRERATRWAEILGTCDPRPELLLATKPSLEHPRVRPIETLQPLADRLKLKIETPHLSDAHDALATMIRTNARFTGRSVVICWVHQSLPELARELGATNAPASWHADDYGSVWRLTYSTNGVCGFSKWAPTSEGQ